MSIETACFSVTERFTSPEEYIQGAPLNHTTELDGLWCSASLPEGSVLVNWPFIPTGANATFQNILSACTTNATNVVDEDLCSEPTPCWMIQIATTGWLLHPAIVPFIR